jgi:hypothetical protein
VTTTDGAVSVSDPGTDDHADVRTDADAPPERLGSDASRRSRLRAWLRAGSFGPTDLSHRGLLLVLLSVVLVLVPVLTLTLMDVDAHLALKVWLLAITVIALLGAMLRVVADIRPTPRADLDRAGKAVGAVAALYTAAAVIIDWSILHL